MDVQQIVGRFGRRWLWCALGAMLALGPGAASAQNSTNNPCESTLNPHPTPIPQCQDQQKATISYNGLETKGWAYYCDSPQPYFYPLDNAWSMVYGIVGSGAGFTGTENAAAEVNDDSKFDGTFTNWDLESNNLIIFLACAPHLPGDRNRPGK